MQRSPIASPPAPDENPLVPNSLLRDLATTMQALRALRRGNVRGEEAVRASALLTVRSGDLLCDLSGADAGRTLSTLSAPLWLDPPSADPAQSLLLLLGAAHALAALAKRSPERLHPGAESSDQDRAPLLLVFVAGASLSRPQWRTALNLAGRNALPLVLVTLPQTSPRPGDLSDRSRGFGVPGIPVDGNDAVALCRVLSESTVRARHGDGPTLIEAIEWPLGPRPEDPVRRHLQMLRRRGLVPPGEAPAIPAPGPPSRRRAAAGLR